MSRLRASKQLLRLCKTLELASRAKVEHKERELVANAQRFIVNCTHAGKNLGDPALSYSAMNERIALERAGRHVESELLHLRDESQGIFCVSKAVERQESRQMLDQQRQSDKIQLEELTNKIITVPRKFR